MITGYRKPLDPDVLVIEVGGRDEVLALRSDLLAADSADLMPLTRQFNRYLEGHEMPLSAEGDGPYRVKREFEAKGYWMVSIDGWGIGYSFSKESIAREAAATLNALVALDRK